MAVAATIPDPLHDESESDFVVRAHLACQRTIPNTDERNTAIYAKWRSSRGPTDLQKIAAQKFSDREFIRKSDVPIFCEHETTSRDGVVSKYDRAALSAIADKCNHRIADTGDFAGLSFGHTPAAEGGQMPELAGFSGPFRLGMIGNKDPRWAIFADEYHYRDVADRVSRSPRRSPEVWLEPRIEDRFMDPIAALGAEAPRLNLGMRFAKLASGRAVERYAATMPAACAVNVPKDKYDESQDPTQDSAETPDMLTDDDVSKVVSAVMATAPMQWVTTQMTAEAAPADGTDPDGAGPLGAGDAAPPVPGADAPGGDPPAPAAPPVPGAGSPPPFDKDKNMKAAFAKRAGEQAEVERYAKLEQRLAEVEKANVQLSKEKTCADRYSRLTELRRSYSFDIESEVKDALDMSEPQFTRHCARIKENYSRIPVDSGWLPTPGMEAEQAKDNANREKYSKAASALAIRERSKGNDMSFEEALEKVQSKNGAAA